MLSDAEAELEREVGDLRSELIRERRARQLRNEVAELAAATSGMVSRAGVADVIAKGAASIFSAGWAMVAYVGEESLVRLIHGPGVPDEIERDWRMVPLDTEVPLCEILRGDASWIELATTDDFAPWPIMVAEAQRAEMHSFVAGRVGSASKPAAAICIAWPISHRLDDVERELIELMLGIAAPAFERAVRTETDGELATAVQTWLRESHLPEVDGLEVATLYEPGRDLLAVGGDWFDLVSLDADRTAIVIGDVVGHDVRAAIEMSQVRHVLAANLIASLDPAVSLQMTDSYLRQRSPHTMATALVMIHRRDGHLTIASAGHPPPLMVTPAGTSTVLPCGLGPPLGAGLGVATNATATIAPGDTLVAYTDGVIETRDRTIDECVELLRLDVGALVGDLEHDERDTVAHKIIAALVSHVKTTWRIDDAAAIVVHRRPE